MFSISSDHLGGANGALENVLICEDCSSRAVEDNFGADGGELTSSTNGFFEDEAVGVQYAGTSTESSFSGPLVFKFGVLISSQCHHEK
jgi:hypothetical protein